MTRDVSGSRFANVTHEPSPQTAAVTSAGVTESARTVDGPGTRIAVPGMPADAIEFRVSCPDAPTRRLRLCGSRYSLGCGDGCSIRLGDEGLLPLHAVLIREPDRVLIRAHSVPLEINGDRVAEGLLRVGDRLRLGSYLFELVGTHLPALPDVTISSPGDAGEPNAAVVPGDPPGDPPPMPDEPLESAEFDRRPHRFGPAFDSPRAEESRTENLRATDAVRGQLEEERRRLEAELQKKIGELEAAVRLTRTETDQLRDEHRKANEHLRQATDELCLLRESNRDLVSRLEQTRSELRQTVGELERRPTHDAFQQLRQQLEETRRPSEPDARESVVESTQDPPPCQEPEHPVSHGWQRPHSLAAHDDADAESRQRPDRPQIPPEPTTLSPAATTRSPEPGTIPPEPGTGGDDASADSWEAGPVPEPAVGAISLGPPQPVSVPGDAPADSAPIPSPDDPPRPIGDLHAEFSEQPALGGEGSPAAGDADAESSGAPMDEDEESSLARQLIREFQDETAGPRFGGISESDGPDQNRDNGPSAEAEKSQPFLAATDAAEGRAPAAATEWMADELPAAPRDSGLATDPSGGWAESPSDDWDEDRVAGGDAPFDPPGRESEAQEPAPQGPVPAASAAAMPRPEEEDDDSIEAYMNRLLQRVHGAAAPPPSDPELKSDARKAGPVVEPLETDAALAEPGAALAPADQETSSLPRSLAPEKGETLSSLRQVANDSAHAAIIRSVQTQIRDLRFRGALKAAAGSVTFVTGVAAWGWIHGGLRVVGVIASLLVTGFFLFEAFGLFRETRRRAMALDAARQVVGDVEAAPED